LVLKLNEKMLHDWMGVKTGTVIAFMNSIKIMQKMYVDELSDTDSMEHGEHIFQAGGHGNIQRVNDKPGIIKKKANSAECEFYLKLEKNKNIPDEIRTLFPLFDSIAEEMSGLITKKFLLIEDITHGMKQPCIMDVKMGTRTAGEDSNIFKKNFMISKDKSTTSFVLGLRLVALKTYNVTNQTYYEITRSEANEIGNKEMLHRALLSFFNNGEKIRVDVVTYYIKRIYVLLNWMKEQTLYRFYSSSLLFVYDGADLNDNNPVADVRMIDFAHVFEIKDGGTDKGYTKGLKQLLKFFESYQVLE